MKMSRYKEPTPVERQSGRGVLEDKVGIDQQLLGRLPMVDFYLLVHHSIKKKGTPMSGS